MQKVKSGTRFKLVETRGALANQLAKLEKGKSQAKVGDIREALRLLIELEVIGISVRARSIMIMLRKEARDIAKKRNIKF